MRLREKRVYEQRRWSSLSQVDVYQTISDKIPGLALAHMVHQRLIVGWLPSRDAHPLALGVEYMCGVTALCGGDLHRSNTSPLLYRKYECQSENNAAELGNAFHLGGNSRCSRVYGLRLLTGCVLEIGRVNATF